MKRGDRWILIITALALLLIGGWFALETSKLSSRDPLIPEMSTFSARPSGAKALYLLAEQSGHRPVRWTKSFRLLRDQRGSLLSVVTGGAYDRLDQHVNIEGEALEDWVSKGNVAMLSGLSAMDYFDVLPAPASESRINAEIAGEEITLAGVRKVWQTIPKHAKAYIRTRDGALVVRKKVGNGIIYGLADETILSNANLGNEDNAALLALLESESKTILFDEYHLGFESPRGPFDILPTSVRASVWIMIGLVLLAVLKSGSRLGRPIDDSWQDSRRSGAELAVSLGRLLMRAKAAQLSHSEMAAEFRARNRIEPAMSLGDFAKSLAIGPEITERLAGIDSTERGRNATASDLKQAAKTFSEAQRAIDSARKGN